MVYNHGTSCAETHCKFMCCWQGLHNRLNSTVISEMVLCQSSLTISGTLSSSSPTQPVEVWHEHSQSSTKVSSCLNLENHSKVYSLHMALLLKAMHFWCSFPSFEAQLNGDTIFFFKPAIRKSQLSLNVHNNKLLNRCNAEGCNSKTQHTYWEDRKIVTPKSRSCTIAFLSSSIKFRNFWIYLHMFQCTQNAQM